jgi:PAS domain S-box-containing protein
MTVSTTSGESEHSTGGASFQDGVPTRGEFDAIPDRPEVWREREALYQLIFNQAGDAIELIDAETLRFIELNDTACRLLGYTREELIGRSLLTIQVDLDEATIRANLNGLFEGSGKLRIENRHRCKDGRILEVQVGIQIMRLNGRDCFVGVWRDIGAEKAARMALTNEAEWRRALIEHSRDGIAIFDHEHRFIEANPRFVEMIGYAPDELIGLHSWDIDADLTEADIRAGFADPLSVNITFETRHQRKDGGLYDAEVSIQGAHIGGRDVFISTTRDISERKQARQALRESEERYRSLVDGSPDIVYSFSDQRGGLFWSTRVEEILGSSVQQLQADPYLWSRSIHPEDRPQIQTALADFERGVHFDLEYRIKDRCGQWRWLRDRSIQRRVIGDEVIVDGLASDITERKHTEQALIAAKLTAEAATSAKSTFLAYMSHELRTPLNAVLGLTQVLERSTLLPEQHVLVEQIRLAGQAMLQISNDILDLAKIEADQLAIELGPCSLTELLQRLDALQGEAAHIKGLSLDIRPSSDLDGYWLADALRLEQVLVNLVSNAIKFTDQGVIRVWIEPLTITEQSAHLRFVVSDTGIGIPPEAVESLFTPFTQVDGSITRRFGGTGLGLSISKRLVELMGGEIGVESRMAEGSTFWFELTLDRTALAAVGAPAPSPARPVNRKRLAGMYILIVDDNPLNLEVLTRLLDLEGARATPALDGQAALECLREHPTRFQAVLMDIQMPVMDGLSATRAIRHELGRRELPVIALSAGVLQEEQQQAREAGCDDFLAKPVELERLVGTLLRWAGAAISASVGHESERDVGVNATDCHTDTVAIAGIDPKRFAQLAQGDAELTGRLLRQFLADITDIPRLVQTDLAQGENERAAARLHGLRGAAANLGALELAQQARELEEAILTADSRITEHSTRFRACFETLHQALTSYLGASSPSKPFSEPADTPKPATISTTTLDATKFSQFRDALAANRPQPARRLFTELEPDFIALYGDQTARALAMALDSLRFVDALDVLDAAAAS